MRLGISQSKNKGFAQLISKTPSLSYVFFLDANVEVSEGWIDPLLLVMMSSPLTIALPMLDIIDPTSGEILEGGKFVTGFDWKMNAVFEEPEFASKLNQAQNQPTNSQISSVSPLISPAAHGMMGISTHFFRELEGFLLKKQIDLTLFLFLLGFDGNLYPYGMEGIELAMKAWRCNFPQHPNDKNNLVSGQVVVAPCSRIAHLYPSLHEFLVIF